jgi:leader peptidase (prepilin peptidase)/N-methyltransferase
VNISTVEYLVVLAILFVLGSVIGSLLNVCIYRLPRDERFWPAFKNILYPPSHCPRCLRRIPFYDNIPILGWILLRGRCRGCRGRISIRYPLVELLTATLFVAVYWCEIPDWWAGAERSSLFHIYGPTGLAGSSWMTPLAMLHWRYALHMLLVVALIMATFIDIDLKIIPDTVTLPAMAAGIAGNVLLGHTYLVPLWYQSRGMQFGFPVEVRRYLATRQTIPAVPTWFDAWTSYVGVPAWMTGHPHWHGLCVALAGIVVGGGLIWAVRIAGRWGLRRESMGFGDVVLLAMIGSFVGWQAAIMVFFVAPLCALVVVLLSALVRFDREIPFGPYLSLATVLLLLGWRWLSPIAEGVLQLGPFLPAAAAVMFVALIGMLHAMRILLKRLGFEHREPEPDWGWTAGDQLSHLAGECVDDRQGQWPHDPWRGTLTGRGQAHVNEWRRGGRK